MLHIIQMHNIYSIDYIIPYISKFKQKKSQVVSFQLQPTKNHSNAFTQCFNAILFFKETLWEYLSRTRYFI